MGPSKVLSFCLHMLTHLLGSQAPQKCPVAPPLVPGDFPLKKLCSVCLNLLQASSDRAPALLQLAASLAASPLLVPLLADCQTLAPVAAAGAAAAAPAAAAAALERQGLVPSEEPWAAQERLGSRQAISRGWRVFLLSLSLA